VSSSPPSPLYAAFDIGTNTLLALIAGARPDGSLHVVEDLTTITRLGEGVDQTRRLIPSAMDRAFRAAREFRDRALELGSVHLSAVATSAVRDADNREEFLAEMRKILGPDVHVISGEQEARLTFAGAIEGVDIQSGAELLVFDIGGGSTEIIAGRANGPPSIVHSLDVGSVRLTERFVRSDPPASHEIDGMRMAVSHALERVGNAPRHSILVGLAATVTTLAALSRAEASAQARSLHGCTLTLTEVDSVTNRLIHSTLEERRAFQGLDPARADVIIAGALLVQQIMRWSAQHQLRVSQGGVRFGLVLERIHYGARA
jgi:exopolyphosphatase / guanosine-5'-triphosphate,3'-diphosphate pyrophosphatase